MTREQERALALQIESVLRRREAGLEPGWRQWLRRAWELREIELYWRARDPAAEEKNG